MEGRMTVCNMAIEAGARAGMVAPDEKTFAYIKGKPMAPSNELWGKALDWWKSLPSDDGAVYDTEITLQASEIVPTVTWGTSPEDALPITDYVPNPEKISNYYEYNPITTSNNKNLMMNLALLNSFGKKIFFISGQIQLQNR